MSELALATKSNKSINYAPTAPDSLHYATLRTSCRLFKRYVNKGKDDYPF